MKIPSFATWLALMACTANDVSAFTPTQLNPHIHTRQAHTSPLFSAPVVPNGLEEGEESNNKHNGNKISSFRKIRSKISRKVKPVSLALLTLLSLEKTTPLLHQSAHASAPVMLMPKMKQMDPEEVAFDQYYKREDERVKAQMAERQRNMREIEARDGKEARIAYERAWDRERKAESDAKVQGLDILKRSLLDQGICPFVDPEGFRQITKYETGMDLADFEGTQANMEKINQEKYPEQSQATKKKNHRFIIQCKVQDLKRRGMDPLQYFEDNQRETTQILEMFPKSAAELANQFRSNLEQYGQIVPPKDGEEPLPPLATVETETAAAVAAPSKKDIKAEKAAAKTKAQEEKAAAKAKAQEEKAAAKVKAQEEKAAAKAEKQKAKEEAKAAKDAAKQEKATAKEAAKAAAAAAAATTAATAAAAASAAGSAAAEGAVSAGSDLVTTTPSAETGESTVEGAATATVEGSATPTTAVTTTTAESSSKIPIVPASAAFVVTAVGGGYAFKVYKEKADLAEEERQRQFKLIMGDGDAGDSNTFPGRALEEVDVDTTELLDDLQPPTASQKNAADSPVASTSSDATSSSPAPKKKKGIKSMFSKKNTNDRETDLTSLVSPGAEAPEFALLLAKILTFGAPGRFPQVIALPGIDMPMTEFVLDDAKSKLLEFRTTAGLSDKASAEVFANVVNCMLIDIVDLASSTLREKDTKITVDAINIVVDFMNHAASLYDAVAGDVVINPVTYGGRLGKGKLEQMFTAYATSANADQDRLQLLQDVFVISDKKVEGIMMKDMQKKMMAMMKGEVPEGMEGMEEMMAAMAGGEGMEGGLPGMGDLGDMPEPSAEETKQMLTALKDMKDAGMIPKEELVEVRKQFADSFGASIDELMAKADGDAEALSPEEKEMLDLMKSILDD